MTHPETTTSAHVFLMSEGGDGRRDEYWFGTTPTVDYVLNVLAHWNLSVDAEVPEVVREFLANPSAHRPDLETVDGRVFYLSRHRHHRIPG